MHDPLKSMLWLLFACIVCLSALWFASEQAELEQDVLEQLVPYAQRQKDIVHTRAGIAVQDERYSGAEIMHSLKVLEGLGAVVEIDGKRLDLRGADSDDYSVQDAAVMRAAPFLDLRASYGVQADYDSAGHLRKINFRKK